MLRITLFIIFFSNVQIITSEDVETIKANASDSEQTTCGRNKNYTERFYFRSDLVKRMRESKQIKLGILITDGYLE